LYADRGRFGLTMASSALGLDLDRRGILILQLMMLTMIKGEIDRAGEMAIATMMDVAIN